MFSADKQWEGIEKCLITARRLGGHDAQIVPLLYECALAPFFLGHAFNLPLLGIWRNYSKSSAGIRWKS